MAGSLGGRIRPPKTAPFPNGEMTSPLIGKDAQTVATSPDSDVDRDSNAGDSIASSKPLHVLKSTVAVLVAAAGAAASILSFIQVPEAIVYVMGAICIAHFPAVAYKERKLLRLPGRRKAVEQLEEAAEQLRAEGDYLEEEVEYLLAQAARFGEVEQELNDVARDQGYSVEELLELIRLNEETMDMMRENLRQKVIQDVVEIVLRSEKRPNQVIDRVEAKLLALKIAVKLEAYGITFDDDKFLRAVALHPTLWGVAATVRRLLPPDDGQVDDSRSVQSIESDKNDVYDMFYMSPDEERRRGSRLAARISEGGMVSLAKRPKSAWERHRPRPGSPDDA